MAFGGVRSHKCIAALFADQAFNKALIKAKPSTSPAKCVHTSAIQEREHGSLCEGATLVISSQHKVNIAKTVAHMDLGWLVLRAHTLPWNHIRVKQCRKGGALAPTVTVAKGRGVRPARN